jgi:hypothetical protein
MTKSFYATCLTWLSAMGLLFTLVLLDSPYGGLFLPIGAISSIYGLIHVIVPERIGQKSFV